jgi:hypothetical protein
MVAVSKTSDRVLILTESEYQSLCGAIGAASKVPGVVHDEVWESLVEKVRSAHVAPPPENLSEIAGAGAKSLLLSLVSGTYFRSKVRSKEISPV